jgi:hypothetical protein
MDSNATRYRVLFGIVVSISIAAAPLLPENCPRQARVKDDLATLQGIWVLKTTEYLGEKDDDQDPTENQLSGGHRSSSPVEEWSLPVDLKEFRTVLEIKGQRFIWRNGLGISHRGGCIRGTELTEGTFTLDGSHRPPVLTRNLGRSDLTNEEQIVYASYSIEEDSLRLAMTFSNDPKKLPAALVTDKDDDVVMLTFKREKE